MVSVNVKHIYLLTADERRMTVTYHWASLTECRLCQGRPWMPPQTAWVAGFCCATVESGSGHSRSQGSGRTESEFLRVAVAGLGISVGLKFLGHFAAGRPTVQVLPFSWCLGGTSPLMTLSSHVSVQAVTDQGLRRQAANEDLHAWARTVVASDRVAADTRLRLRSCWFRCLS